MKHELKTENFSLLIEPQIFEADIKYSSNTLMSICVNSNGFAATATMDIDAKDLARSSLDLSSMYESLKGEAKLQEPYGYQMYISFSGNGRGHFLIKGFLTATDCFENKLFFENDIDQSFLKDFCTSLRNEYGRYLK